MVFCNKTNELLANVDYSSHNPYFNRWFSAIQKVIQMEEKQDCHNPYFNRWFSAIILTV